MTLAKTVRGAGITIAAQSVSSLTNFVTSALVLLSTDLETFGLFAVAFNGCQLVVTITQGSLGDSILIRSREFADDAESGPLRSGAALAGVLLGGIAGVVMAAIGVAVGGDLRPYLLIGALGSPALVAQYVLRAQLFARQRPLLVVVADVVWFSCLVVAAIGAEVGAWTMSAERYLVVWLFGAAVSGFPVLARSVTASRGDFAAFVSVTGPQTVRLGIEAALARSVFVTSLVTATIVVDSAASGALAAAVLVLSPLTVTHVGLSSFVVPRRIRAFGIHVPSLRPVLRMTAVVIAITVGWAAVLVIVNLADLARGPFNLSANGVGWWLFAASVTRFLALAAWRGPLIALRIADATEESLSARALATVAQWILPIVGFWAWGLTGGAMALAIATWVGTALAWREWADLRQRADRGGG
ncbi:MAG: hypothetical protein R2695_07495 [Acidimicrobiales bacterium]